MPTFGTHTEATRANDTRGQRQMAPIRRRTGQMRRAAYVEDVDRRVRLVEGARDGLERSVPHRETGVIRTP